MARLVIALDLSAAVGAAAVAALAVLTTLALAAAVTSQRSHTLAERLSDRSGAKAPPKWFGALLQASGLAVAADRAWLWTVRSALVAVPLVAWRRPLVVGVVLVTALAAARFNSGLTIRSQRRDYDPHLAAVMDHVLFRLAAGSSLAAALESAAAAMSGSGSPVADDLARVVQRVRRGVGVQAALDDWARRVPTVGVRLMADALAIAGASGGSQQSALARVQATVRDHEALAREVRALGSQARTSGVVLALTPIAFAGFVALADPRVAAFFMSPAGWACVAVGLVLEAAGATWMTRLADAVR